MRANRMREIWRSGSAVINGWCSMPDSFSAAIMAHMGWDSIVVDMQHGLIDYQVMVSMLQAISTTAVTFLPVSAASIRAATIGLSVEVR